MGGTTARECHPERRGESPPGMAQFALCKDAMASLQEWKSYITQAERTPIMPVVPCERHGTHGANRKLGTSNSKEGCGFSQLDNGPPATSGVDHPPPLVLISRLRSVHVYHDVTKWEGLSACLVSSRRGRKGDIRPHHTHA